MFTAFIFTSASDRESAFLCRRSLLANGADRVWVVSHAPEMTGPPEEWELATSFPRGRRLNGAACARGMADTMLSKAGGATALAKVDADMLVTPKGVEWLAGVRDRKARGFRLGRMLWCGCWAGTVFHVIDAAAWLEPVKCGACPEASMFRAGFMAYGSVDRAPARHAQVWRAGRPIDPDAWLVTLPSGLDPEVRREELRTLYELNGEDN